MPPLRSMSKFALQRPRKPWQVLILPLCMGWLAASSSAQTQPPAAPAIAAMTTSIEVRNPQGQLQSAKWPWRAPHAARLAYAVQGKFKNLPFNTNAQLDWLPQGTRYESSQEVQIPVVGSRRQASVGTIGPQGLRPEIFLDRSRKEYSATFDASTQHIRFSRGAEPAAFLPGTQDRMSVFFQVAGMVAAAPKRYPAGTQITIQAASSSRVAPWTFTVGTVENLKLPAGNMAALKMSHTSDHQGDDALQSHLWLAPQLQYLPVRIRLLEDGGRDELDLKLKSRTAP